MRNEIVMNITDPIFTDVNKAREHLEGILWPYGPVCPRCGVTDDRVTKIKGKSTRPGVYKCKDCRKNARTSWSKKGFVFRMENRLSGEKRPRMEVGTGLLED